MKYVIIQSNKVTREERLQIIQMEIDYELITLSDALAEDDKISIAETKEKLANLVYERQSIEHTLAYV